MNTWVVISCLIIAIMHAYSVAFWLGFHFGIISIRLGLTHSLGVFTGMAARMIVIGEVAKGGQALRG